MTTDISQEGLSKWREEMLFKIMVWGDEIRIQWIWESDMDIFNETGQLIYRT